MILNYFRFLFTNNVVFDLHGARFSRLDVKMRLEMLNV